MAENDGGLIGASNNGTKSGENDSDTEHNSDNDALYHDNINSLGGNNIDNNINNSINAINIARIASMSGSGDGIHSGTNNTSLLTTSNNKQYQKKQKEQEQIELTMALNASIQSMNLLNNQIKNDANNNNNNTRTKSKYNSTLWIGFLCIILTIYSLSIVYLLFIKSDNCRCNNNDISTQDSLKIM